LIGEGNGMKLTIVALMLSHLLTAQCTIQSPATAAMIGSRDVEVTVQAPVNSAQTLAVTDSAGVVRSQLRHLKPNATGFLRRWVPLDEGSNTIRIEDEANAMSCSVTVMRVMEAANYPDDRDSFEASAYLGLSVDTFTASDFRSVVYNNPNEASEKRERMIGGFDFGYRLIGDPHSPKQPQLWIYGETLHGARSAEVDCSGPDNTKPSVCSVKENPLNPQNAVGAGQKLVYLLRNASTLEGFVGLRAEFLPIQLGSRDPARLYVNGQLGFLSIADSGGDVFDVHHVGLGAVSTAGRFEGSHLEVGYGRNDVFLLNRHKRFKVDGCLTWGGAKLQKVGLKPFFQLLVDADLSNGADSVQTFFGLNFDLSKIF
jgi:hypothetical protein